VFFVYFVVNAVALACQTSAMDAALEAE